jgi:mitochondrial import inner membrane translocase subunit TIM44
MDADAHNPTLVVQFMCQQIDCVRDTSGEVIEGADDRVQAFFYMLAFVRDFDETEQELRWRVRDFLMVVSTECCLACTSYAQSFMLASGSAV